MNKTKKTRKNDMPLSLSYTLTGSLTVPDGTTFSESGNEIVLPCGKILKLWEAIEDHEQGENLTEVELNSLGVFTNFDFERTMELEE